RAMLVASLNPLVRAVGPRVDALVATLLDAVADASARAVERIELAGQVDLVAAFPHPLPIQIIAELFVVPERDRARFTEWSRAVARGMDRFYSGGEAGNGLRDIGAYFLELVRERAGTPGDDLVSRLLQAAYGDDRLGELETVAMCTALVFGGHETTVNLIGTGMLALLRDPEAFERLRAEPDLAPSAVEEMLRFDSPAQLVSRIATGGIELRGRRVTAGDTVVAAVGAANPDPEAFVAPHPLHPRPSPTPHLAPP